jgi:predicted DsbA family dithiol-disulfide isomerase
VVERLKSEYDVVVEWKPFFLHPEMPPEGMELPAAIRARMAGTHERLLQMAHAAGMEMVFSEHIPNSRRALEATEYARAQGKGLEFHRVVFGKFYGEGQDISRWEVLRAAAQEVGLDADAMQHETESGSFTAGFDAQIEEAYSLGITGVPTYILNDKYAIVGAQPYEVFKRAIARLEKEDLQ